MGVNGLAVKMPAVFLERNDDKLYAQLRAKSSIFTCNYHFYLHGDTLIIIKRVNGTVMGVYEGKPSLEKVNTWIAEHNWDDLFFCKNCGMPRQHGYYCDCEEFTGHFCSFQEFQEYLRSKDFQVGLIEYNEADDSQYTVHYSKRGSDMQKTVVCKKFELD